MPVTLRRDMVETTGREGAAMIGYGFHFEDPSRTYGTRDYIDYGPRLWKKWEACSFELVGESHHERELRDPSFQAGSALLAVAEDNPYDSNAVAIWNAERTLHGGYIGREEAATARELLEQGVEWYVLWEWRVEGRRTGLRLLAAKPGAITWPLNTSAVWPPPFDPRSPARVPSRRSSKTASRTRATQTRSPRELAREERRGTPRPAQEETERRGLLGRLFRER